MKKTVISLIHPSRGRAKKAFNTYSEWILKASQNFIIEHILSADSDDNEIEIYKAIFNNVIISDNCCVVEATNIAAKKSKGDILVYLSDDFYCPEKWDESIVEAFGNRISEPCLLKVDDCLQSFAVKVLTIPIMTRHLYNKLGYFWHPEYKSMFVDEDLWWTCDNNNWIIKVPYLRFEHHHPANGKAKTDETYTRSSANWNQGKEIFAKRKSLNFPI